MKVAVIGSRNCGEITVEQVIERLPKDAGVIISGGAVGVDSLAREAASQLGLQLIELLPNYECFGKTAPLVRNREIVEHADCVVAFWDYASNGTRQVILECLRTGKPVKVYMLDNDLKLDPKFC